MITHKMKTWLVFPCKWRDGYWRHTDMEFPQVQVAYLHDTVLVFSYMVINWGGKSGTAKWLDYSYERGWRSCWRGRRTEHKKRNVKDDDCFKCFTKDLMSGLSSAAQAAGKAAGAASMWCSPVACRGGWWPPSARKYYFFSMEVMIRVCCSGQQDKY